MQTFTGHESDINSIVVCDNNLKGQKFCSKTNTFSFSRMDMRLRLEATTRRAGCSTSGLTRSWRCTATTTSSAASPVSPSASLDVCCSLDMMTSTVMSGTRSEQRELVRINIEETSFGFLNLFYAYCRCIGWA